MIELWEHQERQRILRSGGFGGERAMERTTFGGDDEPPSWPSGLCPMTGRSVRFDGTVALCGMPKLGKSLIALGSSLEAAEEGWRVVYCDAENRAGIIARRLENWLGVGLAESPRWFAAQWAHHRITSAGTIEALAEYVSDQITQADDKVLIVIDSANRLAKRMAANPEYPMYRDYFACLGRITDWASTVTTLTRGRVAFLLISELNRKGGAAGLDIEYSAESLLMLTKADGQKRVELEWISRNSESDRLGEYRRMYDRCRFVESIGPAEVAPAAEVVLGPGASGGFQIPARVRETEKQKKQRNEENEQSAEDWQPLPREEML